MLSNNFYIDLFYSKCYNQCMKKLKIAICDDDILIQDTIANLIKNECDIKRDFDIVTYSSAEDLMRDYDKPKFIDILFMDIEVGDTNGIEIIEKIRLIDTDVIVIFITSYIDYVAKAFRVGAFQYLCKPIKQVDFHKDFLRAINQFETKHTVYEFKNNGNVAVIEYKEIIALEIWNKKIKLHTKNEIIVEDGRSSIADKEEQFEPYNFVRCHKSYLVNLHSISKIGKEDILLFNGTTIPLSRNYRNQVLTEFNIYLAGCKI